MAALSEEATSNVRRQVEFYFSNSNLPNDKFLLKTVEESADGFVCLRLVCSFARMRKHLGIDGAGPDAVSTGIAAAVGEALRACPSLKVSDDGLRVGRATSLLKPEEIRADIMARSLALSPVPYNASREQVERLFDGVAKVNSVRLPRHPGLSCSTGHAVVEFATVEEAQKVPGLGLTFEGATLEFQPKASFDEYMSGLAKQEHKKSRGRDNHVKGLIVKFTLAKRKNSAQDGPAKEDKQNNGQVEEKKMDVDSKPQDENGTAAAKAEEEKKDEDEKHVGAEEEKQNEKPNKDGETNGSEAKSEDKSNAVAREDIKAVVEQYGKVKFIDFSRGNTSGYIRFETPEDADKARTAAVLAEEGGLIILDQIATLEAVQGQAESDYWKAIHEGQLKRKEANGSNNRKGGRRFNNRDKRGSEKKGDGQSAAKHKRFDEEESKKHARSEANEDDGAPEKKVQKIE